MLEIQIILQKICKAASGGVFLQCGTPRTLRKGMPSMPRTLQSMPRTL